MISTDKLYLSKQTLSCGTTKHMCKNPVSYVSMFSGLHSTHIPLDTFKGKYQHLWHKYADSHALDTQNLTWKKHCKSYHLHQQIQTDTITHFMPNPSFYQTQCTHNLSRHGDHRKVLREHVFWSAFSIYPTWHLQI